jgi:hypothetical protein
LRAVCSGGCCGYCDNGMDNITFYISGSGTIDMTKVCDKRFFTSICNKYCTEPYNEKCLNPVVNNCFNLTTDEEGNNTKALFTNDTCKNWIVDNVRNGGNAAIDDKINISCNELRINPLNYTNDPNIENICACHFDDTIYENYYQSILEKVPGLQFGGLSSAKCLFPGCPKSQYKPIDILGQNQCPSVQCIQGGTLNNEGRITGDISISQDSNCIQVSIGKKCSIASDCPQELTCLQDSCQKTCSNNLDCPSGYRCNTSSTFCEKIVIPTPSPSPGTTGNIGLIIGISVVVIIIIVIIFIVIFGSKKSK